MENEREQRIINLMQELVDKLDEISDEIQNKDKKIQSLISENYKLQTDKIIENLKLNAKLYREKSTELSDILLDKLENQKPIPSTNNNNHYSLLGEKSSLKSKQIVLILFALTFLWGLIKYGPEYYLEYSDLKKDKENYELFYNYAYLNQFENADSINADMILKGFKNRDSLIMKRYDLLLNAYKVEIKKRQLLKELNALEE